MVYHSNNKQDTLKLEKSLKFLDLVLEVLKIENEPPPLK